MNAAEFMEQALKSVPPLKSQKGNNPTVYIRFVHPLNGWEWYVVEYNPNNKKCWGYIRAFEKEWTYFYLDDLAVMQCGIDMNFKPCTFKELIERKRAEK